MLFTSGTLLHIEQLMMVLEVLKIVSITIFHLLSLILLKIFHSLETAIISATDMEMIYGIALERKK